MTGEQKPGELEPYGWIYETFGPGAGWCAGPEWWPAKFTRTPPNPKTTRNVIALYAHPPAQGSAIEKQDLAWLTGLLHDQMDQSPSARDENGPNEHDERILRILAALQQEKTE